MKGLRRGFCSPAATAALLVILVAWIGYGVHRTWARLQDPDSTIAVELVLLHAPGERVTARGVGLFHSLASENVRGLLRGPCDLELRRDEDTPTFLLLSLAVQDVPPDARLAIRPAGGARLELGPPCGLRTWIALPVQGREMSWRLDPGGADLRYRFPDPLLSARLVRADDRPPRAALHAEMGPAIRIRGGHARPGSGFGLDTEPPIDPIRIDGHAWLELRPDHPGPHTLRLPFERPAGASTPRLWLDGRRLRPRIERDTLAAPIRLEGTGLLTIQGAPCFVRVRDLRLEDP